MHAIVVSQPPLLLDGTRITKIPITLRSKFNTLTAMAK